MYDSMKQLTILVSALLISMSSMAQMYLWQGGQPTNANLDSITFTSQQADNSFTIVENTLSMYESATYTLTMENNLYPANQYRWQSGNTRVATVDANGTITAKNQGMTIIMATYGARTQMCILWVYETPLLEVFQFSRDSLKLMAGVTRPVALQMCCLSDEVVKPTITYTSSDPRVVTVDAKGNATGMKEGTAKIIASIPNLSDTCDVRVYETIPYATIQLEITNIVQSKCSVSATPSYEEGYYYCGYDGTKNIEGMSDSELTELVLTNIQQDTFKTMKDFLQQGTKNMTVSGLTASTDYVMFAFGIDIETETASPIVTRVSFRTADVVPSNMTFNIRCDSVRSTISASGKETIKSWFSVNPSNNSETYLLAGGKKVNVEQYGDAMAYLQYIEQYYASKGGVDAVLRTGNNPAYLSPTADGDEFIIAVAGYNGGFTTKAYSLTYKYEAAKDGKPARLMRKDTEEDNASELNAIPMILEEYMPTKEGNAQVLPLPVGIMHL